MSVLAALTNASSLPVLAPRPRHSAQSVSGGLQQHARCSLSAHWSELSFRLSLVSLLCLMMQPALALLSYNLRWYYLDMLITTDLGSVKTHKRLRRTHFYQTIQNMSKYSLQAPFSALFQKSKLTWHVAVNGLSKWTSNIIASHVNAYKGIFLATGKQYKNFCSTRPFKVLDKGKVQRHVYRMSLFFLRLAFSQCWVNGRRQVVTSCVLYVIVCFWPDLW